MKGRHYQIGDAVPIVIPNEARDRGSSRGLRKPRFLVAFAPRNDRGWVCQQSDSLRRDRSEVRAGKPRNPTIRRVSLWRSTLILGAVLSLTVSLATRYCPAVRHETHATKIVASRSLDAQRQHLLNDGLHWVAPVAAFVLFEPARVSAAVLPAVPTVTRLNLEDCLYNRPPPSC